MTCHTHSPDIGEIRKAFRVGVETRAQRGQVTDPASHSRNDTQSETKGKGGGQEDEN